MIFTTQYFTGQQHFSRLNQQVATIPRWGKLLLLIAIIPGAVLISLSLLLLGVSILALLLPTLPVLYFIRRVTGGRSKDGRGETQGTIDPFRQSKRVEAVVRDA